MQAFLIISAWTIPLIDGCDGWKELKWNASHVDPDTPFPHVRHIRKEIRNSKKQFPTFLLIKTYKTSYESLKHIYVYLRRMNKN